jgi:hypothetical protein
VTPRSGRRYSVSAGGVQQGGLVDVVAGGALLYLVLRAHAGRGTSNRLAGGTMEEHSEYASEGLRIAPLAAALVVVVAIAAAAGYAAGQIGTSGASSPPAVALAEPQSSSAAAAVPSVSATHSIPTLHRHRRQPAKPSAGHAQAGSTPAGGVGAHSAAATSSSGVQATVSPSGSGSTASGGGRTSTGGGSHPAGGGNHPSGGGTSYFE